MLWTEEMFKVKKPIIAMLHLEYGRTCGRCRRAVWMAFFSPMSSACPTSGT